MDNSIIFCSILLCCTISVIHGSTYECGENQKLTVVVEEEVCQMRCDHPYVGDHEDMIVCFGPSESGICICRDGYLLTHDFECVPPEECPMIHRAQGEDAGAICGKNQVLSDGDMICHHRCPTANGIDIVNCARRTDKDPAEGICQCADGYVLNADEECVLREDCAIVHDCPTHPCGENQVPSDGTYKCPTTCDMYLNNTSPYDCAPACGGEFCTCKTDFVLNADGECVPPSQCEGLAKCDQDSGEVWTNCGTSCEETCAVFGGFEDPPACDYRCIPNTCVCRRDHVRDDTGKCVPRDTCPMKAKCYENEQWTNCGSSCPQTCALELGLEKPKICTLQCKLNTCECAPGYVLDPDGTCVLVADCPQVVECCENEVWTNCGPEIEKSCPSSVNGTYDERIGACVKNKCVCKEGYVRDANGLCVLEADCPVVCGEHEVRTDCGSLCEPTCKTELGLQPNKICPFLCISNTCICEAGYVRDDTGSCVLLEECPEAADCDYNEVFTNCGTDCPETCATFVGREEKCSCDTCKLNTCECKPGYVRDDFGFCVHQSTCPIQCGKGEEWTDCGSKCSESCAVTLGIEFPKPCTSECVENTCKCRPGNYRDDLGVCVPLDECPGYKKCSLNEEWTNCGSQCPETCAVALGLQAPPVCTKQCVQNTCKCKDGYARNQFGLCVRIEYCPQAVECPDNEEWTNCDLGYEDVCDVLTGLVVPGEGCVSGECKKNTCVCKYGYARNSEGVCVPHDACAYRFACGENEVGVAVLGEGSTVIGYTCYCQDGFRRDSYGFCIPDRYYIAQPSVIYGIQTTKPACTCQKEGCDHTSCSCAKNAATYALRCNTDEMFVGCGRNCYETCGIMLGLETVTPCNGVCYKDSCECLPGFIRLTKQSRTCVPRNVEECRRHFHVITQTLKTCTD